MVWELKREELAPLPEIPVEFGDNSDEVEEFCIAELKNAMDNADFNTEKIIADVAHWMETELAAEQVVKVYNHISEGLPSCNGLVTEFNDTIMHLTGSAVNCILLENTTQSKSALFYLAPYIGKPKVDLARSLTTLNEAAKDVKKYPSRTLNSLNKCMEVSDAQAVLGFFDAGSHIKSHQFSYYGAKDAVQFVTKEAYKSSMAIETDDDLLFSGASQGHESSPLDDDRDDSFIDKTDDYSNLFDDDTSSNQGTHGDIGAFLATSGIDPASVERDYQAKAKIYSIPCDSGDGSKKLPVCYQTNYRYTGENLAMLSRHEYFALVAVKEKPNLSNTGVSNHTKRGRKKNAVFEFDKGHPLHATHAQYLRSKQPVVIFSGKPPPHPDPPPLALPQSGEDDIMHQAQFHTLHNSRRKKANTFAMY